MKLDNFRCDFSVRDYEVDMQGIVNNAVYFNYLEHCRSLFVERLGINVYEWHKMGYNLSVIRSEIDYKSSLKSKDHFYVVSKLSQSGRLRLVFEQKIFNKRDDSLVVKAIVTGVCIDIKKGKPCMPEELQKILITVDFS